MSRLYITWRLGLCVGVVNAVILLIWTVGLVVDIKMWPGEFVRLIAPNGEANFIAWYSGTLLILAAIAALANFYLDGVGEAHGRSRWRLAWLGVSAVMLLLSLEEVAQIHEAVGALMRGWLAGPEGESQWAGVHGRAWILAYLPFILAVVVGFFWTFARMFRHHRVPFVLATGGVCFWLFALLMEFFLSEFRAWGMWYYGLEITLEESGEILGTSALLIAFVWYGEKRWREVIPMLAGPQPHPGRKPGQK